MRNWLFRPFNDLGDRRIDVIAMTIIVPALFVIFALLLMAYPELA